jgi:hypothetical protein
MCLDIRLNPPEDTVDYQGCCNPLTPLHPPLRNYLQLKGAVKQIPVVVLGF